MNTLLRIFYRPTTKRTSRVIILEQIQTNNKEKIFFSLLFTNKSMGPNTLHELISVIGVANLKHQSRSLIQY